MFLVRWISVSLENEELLSSECFVFRALVSSRPFHALIYFEQITISQGIWIMASTK